MPQWTSNLRWKGQDAVIIGGGSSLANFDFNFLKGRNTIGCNDAFHLGPEIVQICLFGDGTWFQKNKAELAKFPKEVITCSMSLQREQQPWLWKIQRIRDGLHPGPLLGWNYSTGAAAVNLAIQLGAVHIFLLGFDMGKRQDGKSHWHGYCTKVQANAIYNRFIKGFGAVYKGLSKYPSVRVFNVTDGGSRLPHFSRMDFDAFLKYIPLQDRPVCNPVVSHQQMEAVV